jgi:phenylacetate-CoA ligase
LEHLTPDGQLALAQKLFVESKKSKLYAEKYAGLGEPRSLADWQALPVLTRGEIHSRSFPKNTDMMTCPLEDAIVISTGGSSGVARYTAYSHAEWDAFVEVQAMAFRAMGITRQDRIANLFIAGHFWPSYMGLHDCIKKLGAVHLPISANIPPEEIVKLCLEFEPTVMVSLPTLFVFLADMAARDGFQFKNLRMINYAGEHMSAAAEAHVRRSLGVERIKPGAYTSADAGMMGYPCEVSPSGVYHVPSAFQWIEILDMERGVPAAPGTRGDVVVTNLRRVSTPILRYHVGDAASWVGEPCPCGDPNPILKLAGRSGQDFKIGGGFISMDAFEGAMAQFPQELSLNFQIEISDVGGQFEFVLRVEAPAQASSERLSAMKAAVFAAVPELRISEERKYLREFRLELVELGKLPRSPITGKVVRLRDNRVL